MNAPAPSLLHRWLTLLLAGLLALGPFLHGHFGASHETGFHLDGVHATHTPPTAGDCALILQAADDESPALGVAASLPHSENDGLALAALILLLTLLTPALPASRLLSRPTGARVAPRSLYRAGLPPPSLAPPNV